MVKIASTLLLTLLVASVFAAVGSAPAYADIDTIRSEDNSLWGSLGSSFLNYKEQIPSPDLPDSERGWLSPSIAGGVSFLSSARPGVFSNIYVAIEGSGAFDRATYNGAYLASPTTPLQSTTYEHIWTIDGKVGRAFPIAAVLLTPYIDVGHRTWSRNLGGGQIEDYSNFSTSAGAMLQFAPSKRWVLTAYGSFGTTISPEMQTGGYTYNLTDGTDDKLGLKVGFNLTSRVELFSTLDYEYLHYGQSQVVGDGTYEPNSKTNETALRVGMAYHFR